MRRLVVLLALVTVLVVAMATPAFGIVHGTTPITCNGATEAGEGHAGGGGTPAGAAITANNPILNPPMPATALVQPNSEWFECRK